MKHFSLLLVCLGIIGWALGQQPAFPGAEGFGKYTKGGRGGMVIRVTNLNNSGEGSLREALTATRFKGKKRTIIFDVSGNIDLTSPIEVKYDSCITIAGQTAPGDGICIRNYPLMFGDCREIIVRYIRSRLGDKQNCTSCDIDAISVRKCHHIIIDHCSFSWSIDALVDLTVETGYSTVQYCLIAEALLNSKHSKGAHSMATGWDGNSHGYNGILGGGTYHHNLIASCNTRTPRIDSYAGENNLGSRDLIDIVNNVIYNWSGNGAYGGEHADLNYQRNYYKYGPNTASRRDQIFQPDAQCKLYIEGNFVDSYPDVTADNSKGVYVGGKKATLAQLDTILQKQAFPVEAVGMQTAVEAYQSVLASVGASYPHRDATDVRVVNDVKNRTGKIIDSQDEVGGWPVLATLPAYKDTDLDGMPDAWEKQVALNPKDPADGVTDRDHDGYTNLEEYLNSFLTERLVETEDPDPDPITSRDEDLSKTDHQMLSPTLFTDSLVFKTILAQNTKVKITLCDLRGRVQYSLLNEKLPAGVYENTLETSQVAPGVYMAIVQIGKERKSLKLVKNE